MRYQTILLIAITAIWASSCEMMKAPPEKQEGPVVQFCAEPRLNRSFSFHERAKNYLASYYKTRKESELYFAWYASEDSIYMANTIRRCWDKKNKHFHAVRNIMQKNRIVQKIIVQNMRSDHQSKLSELFLDDYRKIFIRDIQ